MTKRRSLSLTEVVSIGIGGMIGGGIFAVLGLSIQLAKGGAPIAFLLAGLASLLTGYSYAKLSRRFPSYGGTIEYIVKGFGTGIFSGSLNILLLFSYIVMISLYAYAFGSYGAAVLGGDVIAKHVLISIAIIIFTVLNAFGAKISGLAEEMLVGLKLAILCAIGIVGLVLVNWVRLSPQSWADPISLVAGGMIIFLAYEGFELIANAGGDIEDPKKLPKAFYISIIAVIAVYVLISIITIGNLNFSDIIKYRDYALAMVAKPIFGNAGFVLVVLAALASTSSAINATLYGTARASYMIAKLGEIPKSAERKIWKESYEGLFIISGASLVIANFVNLESISTAGSGGFLLVFTMVNLVALRIYKEINANPIIPGISAIATSAAFSILVYRMISMEPFQVLLLFSLIAGSFIVEIAYRTYTSRTLKRTLDKNLMEKEKNVVNWRKWIPGVVSEIQKLFVDADVYLVGNPAKGTPGGSADLVVFTDKAPSWEDEGKVYSGIKAKTGIGPNFPFTITYFSKLQRKGVLPVYKTYKHLTKSKLKKKK